MKVKTEYLELKTSGNTHIVDITGALQGKLQESGLKDGTVTVFVPGATGGVTTIEYEPGLIEDMQELFESIAPQDKEYKHHLRWRDGNGHSHVRASLLGPSLTIPFQGGELILGTWQQVVFIDFDVRARNRRLVLQFMGE
jgi:secondary thiamine-phosphate synthase enzyme